MGPVLCWWRWEWRGSHRLLCVHWRSSTHARTQVPALHCGAFIRTQTLENFWLLCSLGCIFYGWRGNVLSIPEVNNSKQDWFYCGCKRTSGPSHWRLECFITLCNVLLFFTKLGCVSAQEKRTIGAQSHSHFGIGVHECWPRLTVGPQSPHWPLLEGVGQYQSRKSEVKQWNSFEISMLICQSKNNSNISSEHDPNDSIFFFF